MRVGRAQNACLCVWVYVSTSTTRSACVRGPRFRALIISLCAPLAHTAHLGAWGVWSGAQEMLELLRAQEENRHGTRLELVVIWLIVVEVVLGVFELLDLFGVIGPPHSF